MKNRRDIWAVLILALLLSPSLILWAADNFTAKDAAGVTKTFKSKEAAGGVHSPARVMIKTDGVTLYQAVEEATFTGRVGEVQASPTANTVLARLKDILTLTALTTSESHIGKVGYTYTVISQTPTVSTSPAYTSGDLVGGKLTFASAARVSAGGGTIISVTVTDLGKQDAALDLIIYDADPTGTTFTDNAALDVADADLTKVVAVVKLAAADYADFADNSAIHKFTIDAPFKLASGSSLYGALVTRGTPTYTATSDITVRLHVQQD